MSTSGPASIGWRLPLLLGVATIAGAATMVVELAAVRLLAPWFGTSLVVWTNVIAVVLLGLALGYLSGGRLSARGRPLLALACVLVLAAGCTALLPILAAHVTGWFLPERLALHDAAGVLAWSSLATALVLFLPPALLLGMVAPLAVQSVQDERGGGAGRAGGLVLATSTLGSLTGVFGTSHTLLPALGLRGTFAAASGALALAAAVAWLAAGGRRTRAAAVLVPLAALEAWCLAGVPLRAVGSAQRVLAAAETPYQSVRVVEDGSYDPPLRFLQVNEGFDSFQSVWQPAPGLLPEGFYYNAFALPPAWAEASGTWRLLVLGLGAGTTLRVLDGASPAGLRWERTGVEIDPGVVRLARAALELDGSRADTTLLTDLDARAALRALPGPFDYVVLDVFANQVEIPPHLATREFLQEVRARLAPGGWLATNVGGFGFDDPIVAAVARTCAVAFEGPVLVLRVPASRNFVIFARHAAPLPLDPDERPRLPAGELGRWLAPLRLPGGWRVVTPSSPGEVLTDDRAPTERLQARSVAEARARRAAAG